MTDIAKLAGVSVSTVSRALADSDAISNDLKEKIKQIALEKGYAINQAARNLRMQNTRTIGLFLPMGHQTGQHIQDPFLLEMIGHLSDFVLMRDYDILLTRSTSHDKNVLRDFIHTNKVDGLLMLGQSDQHQAINDIGLYYKPLVVWGEKMPDQTYCSVGVDNVLSGKMAGEHLLSLGRKNPLFLGPIGVPEVDSRLIGFKSAIDESRLDWHSERLIDCNFSFEQSIATVKSLIQKRTKFDALFCASDVIAHGVVVALQESGYEVPKDVSVCGFDDVAMARTINPPLTTIKQDIKLGASLMVDMLFKRLSGEMTSSATLPAALIVRGST